MSPARKLLPLCALLLSACGEPPLRIAAIVGEDGVLTARLVEADVREKGEIDGRPVRFRIVGSAVMVESDQIRATVDSIVADESVLAVVGPAAAGNDVTWILERLNAAGLPHILPTPPAVLPARPGPHTFSLVPAGAMPADFVVRQALRLRPGARTVIAYAYNEYGSSLKDAARRRLAAAGVEPAPDVAVDVFADSFQIVGMTAEIADSGPEVLLWLGYEDQLRAALPDLRRRLPGLTIVASDALESFGTYTHPGGLESVYFVRFMDPALAPPAFRKSIARAILQNAWTPTSRTLLTADALRLLVAALESGADTRAEVQQYLESLGKGRPAYEGLSGPVAFNEKGEGDQAYVLVRITDRAFVPVDSSKATP